VDIDLNYIAQVDREKMLNERPDVVRAVDQIATGLGYRIQNGVDDHALREWHLGYANHTGAKSRAITLSFRPELTFRKHVHISLTRISIPPCLLFELQNHERRAVDQLNCPLL
jgi:hypothetical protein